MSNDPIAYDSSWPDSRVEEAIALAAGWTYHADGKWLSPAGNVWDEPPPFTKCLNAMHIAEQAIPEDRLREYGANLYVRGAKQHDPYADPEDFWPWWHIPASVRARQFVIALNLKWSARRDSNPRPAG